MKKDEHKIFPGFPPYGSRASFWSYPKIMDQYWGQITSAEQKVLDYILRRTWGWEVEADEISYSQISRGIKKRDGTVLDTGIGLSKPTISIAIKGLITKGFIRKRNGKKANFYELVRNPNRSSKESLPSSGKNSLHTIDNSTINNRQYNNSSNKKKKPYYKGNPIVLRYGKECVFENGEWLEFGGRESEKEWR